ncbi:MAG TPA: hypothetical protein VIA18_07085 [Polyangia bacterium]|jgi:hypothetical protein|nr:hypothetical protein [Polyangia bacterium]
MTDILDRQRPETCLSDLALDRLVMREPDRGGRAAAHLKTCAACSARLAELESQSRPFMNDVAARQPIRRARRNWAWGGLGVTFAAAAAFTLWLVPVRSPVRTKGGLHFEIIAKHGNSVDTILPGSELAPGDAIRFRLTPPRAGYLGIIGLDAAGNVTPYAPTAGATMRMQGGAAQLLDGSIILDDTAGAERVVALFCARSLDMAAVVDAGKRALAQAGGDPRQVSGNLGFDCASASTWYQKRLR